MLHGIFKGIYVQVFLPLMAAGLIGGWTLAKSKPEEPAKDTFAYQRIVHNTKTIIKKQPGILHTVCTNIPGTTGSIITIYDGPDVGYSVIGTLDGASSGRCWTYDINFKALTIVTQTGAPPDLTVTYR